MISASPAVGGSIENWVMFEQGALLRVSAVFAGPAQSIGPASAIPARAIRASEEKDYLSITFES